MTINYQVDAATGLLSGVAYRHSPNHNDRPAIEDIDTIVIHGISLPAGEFGGPWIDALFMNQLKGDENPGFVSLAGLQVSSHLLLRRDGEVIQYVPFHKRAWHAGVSSFKERGNCNDFSIGIELEGTDEIPYTEIQYQHLAAVIKGLLEHFPRISPDRIIGHCDIAPGRKSDPGAVFDWQMLRQLLAFE